MRKCEKGYGKFKGAILMAVEKDDPNYRKALSALTFTPRTPIQSKADLAGRLNQGLRLIEAVYQPGAHAVIFGEPGVGKTSLAQCTADLLKGASNDASPNIAPRVNCDGTDTYGSLWRKVFSQIEGEVEKSPVGFNAELKAEFISAAEDIDVDEFTPSIVLEQLRRIGSQARLAVIFDEFNRLPSNDLARQIADTIKAVSDENVPATIIVVGIGDSVTDLIRGHGSIGRNLIEIAMPRMSADEQKQIVTSRLPKLGLTIDDAALKLFPSFCRGLPFYVHLLGQKAAQQAIAMNESVITTSTFGRGLNDAIADSEQSLKKAYYDATVSAQKSYRREMLIACATAQSDEYGFFSPNALLAPLKKIRGRDMQVGEFNERLKEFTKSDRGSILQSSGATYKKRYRFSDPLMEPFVLIKSVTDGLITVQSVASS